MHTHRTSPVLLLTGLCLASIITGSAAQTAVLFTQEVYSTAVHETFVDGGFDRPADGFIQVECTYANTTLPAADIEYSIVSSSPGPFSLNQTDGRLSVTADLDYETVQFYSFEVICFNTSDPQINDTADVEITVDPVNECRPDLASRSGTILINEETPVGYLIASPTVAAIRFLRIRFSVSDCDAQPDNNITYTFSEASDQDRRFFNLDLLSGNLTLKEELDVDTITGLTDRISLRLTICDFFPALDNCPNFEVVIIVAPANDNNPQFSQLVYEVTFPESTPVGTTLLEAQCTDDDKGAGAFELIRFQDTVDCNCLEMWELDGTEGIITLSQPLDYETVQRYDFGLICEDTGGTIAAASVVINVEAVNDNEPVFNQTSYEFSVERTASPNGHMVGQLIATDGDVGLGNITTYSLESNENFEIDSITGAIRTTDYILAIEGSEFNLTAVVSDGDFNDTVPVVIHVTGLLLSIPEIIIVAVSALIFTMILCVLFWCCFYCCVKWSRKYREQSHNAADGDDDEETQNFPMHMLRAQGPPFMVGQAPRWGYPNLDSYTPSELSEEPDLELSTLMSSQRENPSMGPVLREVVDIFTDGDKLLHGKKKR